MRKNTIVIITVLAVVIVAGGFVVAKNTGSGGNQASWLLGVSIPTPEDKTPIENQATPVPTIISTTITTPNTPNDPIEVLKAFIDAYNDKDEKRMIELSTMDMKKEIKEANYVNTSLYGMRYAKLENAEIYKEYSNDNLMVLCYWDKKTYEESANAGIQHWSFANLVRENSVWKVGGIGATAP